VLARFFDGFLSTLFQGTKETTTMGRMIAHPEHVLHHGRDPRCSPDLTTKSEGFGSFGQFLRQLRQLLSRQFWGGSRRWLMLQRLRSLYSRLFEPLAHCAFTDAQRFGDVFLFPSGFMQFPCAHASCFAPISWRC
jgi:hypothetical protein